jgi:hypothetical protein
VFLNIIRPFQLNLFCLPYSRIHRVGGRISGRSGTVIEGSLSRKKGSGESCGWNQVGATRLLIEYIDLGMMSVIHQAYWSFQTHAWRNQGETPTLQATRVGENGSHDGGWKWSRRKSPGTSKRMRTCRRQRGTRFEVLNLRLCSLIKIVLNKKPMNTSL